VVPCVDTNRPVRSGSGARANQESTTPPDPVRTTDPSASTASTPVSQRPMAPPGSERLFSPSSSAFMSTDVNGGAKG
jgi:hypothetical protein